MQKTATSEIYFLHLLQTLEYVYSSSKKKQNWHYCQIALNVTVWATMCAQYLQEIIKCWNLLFEGLELDSVLKFKNSSLRANYATDFEAVWSNIFHLMVVEIFFLTLVIFYWNLLKKIF